MKRVLFYLAKMADASSSVRVKKIPDNLYELCLTNLVNYLQKCKCERNDLHYLPDTVLMDVYYKMLLEKRLCILGAELSELDTFEKLLRSAGSLLRLLQCFQAVIEHGSKLSTELSCAYLARCDAATHSKDSLINLGLRLGGFLNEAGWYADAERVLLRVRDICQSRPQTTHYIRLTLECCHRLLNTQSAYCCFPAAAETYSLALRLLGLKEGAPARLPSGIIAAAKSRDAALQTGDDTHAYCDRLEKPPSEEPDEASKSDVDKTDASTSGRQDAATDTDADSETDGSGDETEEDRGQDARGEAGVRGEIGRVHAEIGSVEGDAGSGCADAGSVETEAGSVQLASGSGSEGGITTGGVRAEGEWGMSALLARLCKEFSALFFVRCDYSAAHAWSMQALAMLTPDTPAKITIEVLRACGKACVVKRRFGGAGLLVRQAVALARRAFGPKHPRYAAALLDYGFYLLNIDSITHSVAVYEEALSTLRRVFGRSSLHVATAQEDLAYALYVLEYSSGRFYKARDHAERAIRIIENLVPPDHLLLASAKRVKALILEEIALDTPAGQDMSEPSLLEESEALHKAALALSMMAFGEKNVQTAKHYGNLGRLYQSMQKFQDAEMMHLKAIAIKEELLGAEDYEVGLSVGHLASLYNYHMHMHRDAELLYLRSIAISLKLFGERYSGLEYDYRGLMHVFTQLKRHDRADYYNALLQHWHELREQSKAEQQPALGSEQVMPLEELQAKFFAPND
ncbi:amyloid protein-binding protein 2 [Epargyreus clarus]|uniref:amyloid protein-binding protein 2 n=1 Tax=Epargyreus clarus TaxID=520877 RepID=UPI003C2F2A0E